MSRNFFTLNNWTTMSQCREIEVSCLFNVTDLTSTLYVVHLYIFICSVSMLKQSLLNLEG